MTTGRPPLPADDAARAELARRGRELAATDARADGAAGATVSVLVARRGTATFGVRSIDVRDVRRAARVSPLPGAEHPVAGLTAWRGQGIVVHDVFGGAAVAPREGGAPEGPLAAWLLVVGDRGSELALVADDVDDVVDLRTDALVPALEGAVPALGATIDGMLLLDLRAWIARDAAS
jgi:chemotaxis signal transduction protein